jgi:hypothetical protein
MRDAETVEEEHGFDEEETLGADDIVVLETPDGGTLRCVVLAVVEVGDAHYAVLTDAESTEDDLLVTTYTEDDDGVAHFTPIEDDSVLTALHDALADLLPVEEQPPLLGPPAEA